MKRLITLLTFFVLVSFQGVFAQMDMNAPVPQDKNLVVGKLPNGMTYYLKHNEEPKARASFYIIQNVGALMEDDNQNGLAHFLEHMAFNGTVNFPGKGIIKGLEKHGVSFGGNINAYTSYEQTVYNISNVPTVQQSLLDTCLLVLHDWSDKLLLTDEELDAERGVITEEWRTRRNSQFRIQQQTIPALLQGTMYEKRDVIGSLDVIKHFKYDTIRKFYHDWYRTDLQAIAIIGDIDVRATEAKIKEMFSDIKAVENPKPRPITVVPDHEGMRYTLATDKEAQNESIEITTRFQDMPAEVKQSHMGLISNLVEAMYNGMVQARFAELMQKETPYVKAGIGMQGLVRGYKLHGISVAPKQGMDAEALKAVLIENERIYRYGFTPSELDRIKTNILANLETSYKMRDKITSEDMIQECVDNFLEQEPIYDFDYYYNFVKNVLPQIPVEAINQTAKQFKQKNNVNVIITGPTEGIKYLTEDEVKNIMAEVDTMEIKPYDDGVANAPLMSEDLKGGKIIKEKALPQFNAKEWTLSNNIKVVYRKADYEKESISLVGISKGGSSLYEREMLPSINVAANFVNGYGLGDFDAVTLQKMLTGKVAGASVKISGLNESISGSARPQDLETMFQLIYLRFTKPRFDQSVHDAIMSRQYSQIANLSKNPQKAVQDSLQLIMSNYNKRNILFGKEFLDMISMDKIEQIYKERFANPADFTFFLVGNVDEATVKPYIEKYLGALKTTKQRENWRDNHVRCPKGKTEKVIEIPFETPKTSVVVYYSKEMPYSVKNALYAKILQGVLDFRYTENIREKEGGTYGVAVQTGVSRYPVADYTLVAQFDCDPEKADHLKPLIYDEIDRLIKDGPTALEVENVVKSLKKEREQALPHNGYWMNVLVGYYQDGIDNTDPKNFENIVNTVTPADIQKFTKTFIDKADLVDIMFVPKK